RDDPLGKGQPATWRLLLIKLAASVVVSCRRIVVRLSGSWPNRNFFERISQHVSTRPTVAHFGTGLSDRQLVKPPGGKGAVRLCWLPTAVRGAFWPGTAIG